jgi:hypothetical protein
MDRIPAEFLDSTGIPGIHQIPPEFLDSAGFRRFRPESVGEWKVLVE